MAHRYFGYFGYFCILCEFYTFLCIQIFRECVNSIIIKFRNVIGGRLSAYKLSIHSTSSDDLISSAVYVILSLLKFEGRKFFKIPMHCDPPQKIHQSSTS